MRSDGLFLFFFHLFDVIYGSTEKYYTEMRRRGPSTSGVYFYDYIGSIRIDQSDTHSFAQPPSYLCTVDNSTEK